MKEGVRALGVAESYPGSVSARPDDARATDEGADEPARGASAAATDDAATGHAATDDPLSTVAGAVVRADRAVDDLQFFEWTVGGLDATDAVVGCWRRLDRPDVRYLLLAGVAPAWFNLLDLAEIHEAVDRPVVSVSFEESAGLAGALREQFSGAALADRLAVYEGLPQRHPVDVNDDRLYVRAAGCDPETAATVVRAFTPAGGRPEPLRVARLAARAARAAFSDGEA